MSTVIINGKERHLGWRQTPPATISRMHREGSMRFYHERQRRSVAKPQADWVESDCSHFWTIRKDQDGRSMCVGFSGVHAMQVAYAKEGFLGIDLSPAAAYAPICGGSDNGASIGDCLEALKKYGAFPSGEGGIEDLDWRGGYRSKFWRDATSTLGKAAAKYRIDEALLCESLDEFLAGLQSGQWSGQFGLGAGSNFDTDADGWLPRCDGTSINHALCALGGMKRHPKTGNWGIQGANSWADWGQNGVFWCEAEDWLDRPYQELWLIRSTTLI